MIMKLNKQRENVGIENLSSCSYTAAVWLTKETCELVCLLTLGIKLTENAKEYKDINYYLTTTSNALTKLLDREDFKNFHLYKANIPSTVDFNKRKTVELSAVLELIRLRDEMYKIQSAKKEANKKPRLAYNLSKLLEKSFFSVCNLKGFQDCYHLYKEEIYPNIRFSKQDINNTKQKIQKSLIKELSIKASLTKDSANDYFLEITLKLSSKQPSLGKQFKNLTPSLTTLKILDKLPARSVSFEIPIKKNTGQLDLCQFMFSKKITTGKFYDWQDVYKHMHGNEPDKVKWRVVNNAAHKVNDKINLRLINYINTKLDLFTFKKHQIRRNY